MNRPHTCPKCGAAVRIQLTSVREYECRSHDDMTGFHQTSICLSRGVEHLTAERDSLAARVRELEAERNKAVARYECVRRMNAAEFACLLQDCVFKDLRFDDEVDRRIKKAKP